MDKRILESAISYSGSSQREIATRTGITYKSLNKSINQGSLKQSTIKKLCDAMGARYEERIIFPDGQVFTSSD